MCLRLVTSSVWQSLHQISARVGWRSTYHESRYLSSADIGVKIDFGSWKNWYVKSVSATLRSRFIAEWPPSEFPRKASECYPVTAHTIANSTKRESRYIADSICACIEPPNLDIQLLHAERECNDTTEGCFLDDTFRLYPMFVTMSQGASSMILDDRLAIRVASGHLSSTWMDSSFGSCIWT